MVGVESEAIRVEEFLILPVVDDHLIRQGFQQSAIGAGTTGYPLVANRLCRLVEIRIDENDLRPSGLLRIQKMPHVATACRPRGIRAPKDDELGMAQRNAVLRVGNP